MNIKGEVQINQIEKDETNKTIPTGYRVKFTEKNSILSGYGPLFEKKEQAEKWVTEYKTDLWIVSIEPHYLNKESLDKVLTKEEIGELHY